VIRDILNHIGLWLVKARPPPKAHVLQGGHETPCTPMTISFKQTLIPSTVTLKAKLNVHNTHGMNTSSHNAFWKNGVSVRSGGCDLPLQFTGAPTVFTGFNLVEPAFVGIGYGQQSDIV
jgi:hypothetical protein